MYEDDNCTRTADWYAPVSDVTSVVNDDLCLSNTEFYADDYFVVDIFEAVAVAYVPSSLPPSLPLRLESMEITSKT